MRDEHGQPVLFLNETVRQDRAIDELLGLARGLIADGVVNAAEADRVRRWVQQNPDACAFFPGRQLYERIMPIYEDGNVDGDEQQELLWLLQDLAGEDAGIDPDVRTSRLPLTDPAPPIVFEGSRFTLTGRFIFGCRRLVSGEIESRGGLVDRDVGAKTDYLLVGSMASRDWKHTAFGRKIEFAVDMRERGHRIVIVDEHHWTTFIRP